MSKTTGSKFAVFDIDGTLIRWQLYHAIADHLVKLNLAPAESFDSMKSERMEWKRRSHGQSFKSYEQTLIKSYEEVLLKISPAQLEKAIDSVFEEYKDQAYVYTRELLGSLKDRQYLLFAISGSQDEIVAKIAKYYDFDAFIATTYEVIEGKFTGKKTVPAFNKDVALKKLVGQFKASWQDSLAVGDSASDIKMLELVEQPIAFNPERELYEHAKQKHWKIVVERKNVVYQLENGDGSYLLA